MIRVLVQKKTERKSWISNFKYNEHLIQVKNINIKNNKKFKF